ncbi:ABC transporter permease subunit [Rathayibacter rathayi]|uniref:ABC transporter permease subunit n=1 Tax=Rathayibacter rathayi TaxID=33887 RepID=UPI0030B956AF
MLSQTVALIASYLAFFPVSIRALRGLGSPTAHQVELMHVYGVGWWQNDRRGGLDRPARRDRPQERPSACRWRCTASRRQPGDRAVRSPVAPRDRHGVRTMVGASAGLPDDSAGAAPGGAGAPRPAEGVRGNAWQTARTFTLPGAVPYVFTRPRIASSLAVISALVAEYFGEYFGGPVGGLGKSITTVASGSDYAFAYAYVLGAVLVGVVFFSVTAALEAFARRRSRVR